ncbi:hypothetical protein L227DRAFT_212907 [Lentinus tigrinus ALCF2SS1-6]|uniref:Uncharacterized protein n=1 Tax=Lentinus tigrinus ALCF2SS1-6 TaxID=1328759 RepID=A0A5C2SQR9_9APHY|nr:hypothetical protein L227DRAFT_212907 [Lentinus tigrinus ALCF2SS1-6]
MLENAVSAARRFIYASVLAVAHPLSAGLPPSGWTEVWSRVHTPMLPRPGTRRLSSKLKSLATRGVLEAARCAGEGEIASCSLIHRLRSVQSTELCVCVDPSWSLAEEGFKLPRCSPPFIGHFTCAR